jgi:hypothetical protein
VTPASLNTKISSLSSHFLPVLIFVTFSQRHQSSWLTCRYHHTHFARSRYSNFVIDDVHDESVVSSKQLDAWEKDISIHYVMIFCDR